MRGVRRPQAKARRESGGRTDAGAGRSSSGARGRGYLARGRVRVLTVSEGALSARVMVGTVRGPDHLALVRRARFYHVPVSAIAATRTDVAYIAFYEGATRFRGRAGVIREYAAVLRVSRVQRSELPGLTWPGRQGGDSAYYRFDLGPLQELPRPITNPDRLRVVFRFPDFTRFQAAATLSDLGGRRARTPEGRSAKARGGKPSGSG